MGNTCCSSENRSDGNAKDFSKILAHGNLVDSEFAAAHGPKPNVAFKNDEHVKAIKEVHDEMTRLEMNHDFEKYANLGEFLGPYLYSYESSYYYGQYQTGLRNGLGIYVNNKDGFDYEGEFQND